MIDAQAKCKIRIDGQFYLNNILLHPQVEQLASLRFKSNANLSPQTGHFNDSSPFQALKNNSVFVIFAHYGENF
jgi:hypothetical protein